MIVSRETYVSKLSKLKGRGRTATRSQPHSGQGSSGPGVRSTLRTRAHPVSRKHRLCSTGAKLIAFNNGILPTQLNPTPKL
jgi:hypothetical protein